MGWPLGMTSAWPMGYVGERPGDMSPAAPAVEARLRGGRVHHAAFLPRAAKTAPSNSGASNGLRK